MKKLKLLSSVCFSAFFSSLLLIYHGDNFKNLFHLGSRRCYWLRRVYHWALSPVWYFIVRCSEYCDDCCVVSDVTMRCELPLAMAAVVAFVTGRGWNVDKTRRCIRGLPSTDESSGGAIHCSMNSLSERASDGWLADRCSDDGWLRRSSS